MTDFILELINWAAGHPELAGALVALIACLESLAFVGLIFPGAVMMLAAGALVGAGALDFWSTFAWAVAGAILGDGVSYWLGHSHKQRFLDLAFVRARPELLAGGEAFFRKHGGKSVLLARFVGPVRPVLPLVAGMLGMPPVRFYFNNVLSALIWAPAHLVPGMAFGASLALAGQVAGRLAMLLGGAVLSLWLLAWLARVLYQALHPHAQAWLGSAWVWASRHPHLAWLIGDLLDSERPAWRPLLLWLAILSATAWLCIGGIDPALAGQPLDQFLHNLRTPAGDRVMVAVSEAGDVAVIAPLALSVSVWLAWRRAWRDLRYWLAALAFGFMATLLAGAGHPAPASGFLVGHTTLPTAACGFLAVLTAASLAERLRWIVHAAASALILAIAFARLYLGAHWLADVLGGVALGSVWVILLALARARRPAARRVSGLAPLALGVFAAATAWHLDGRLEADLARHAARAPARTMAPAYWWQTGWQQLPPHRLDMEGEARQALNVQWAGDPARLRRTLSAAGWRQPLELDLKNALRWLLPEPPLGELPLLPQLHNGYPTALAWTHPGDAAHPDRQLVLRLWPSGLRTGDNELWLGSVVWQRREKLPLLSFPRNAGDDDDALARLQTVLAPLDFKRVRRAPAGDWSGATLLIRP